MNRRIPLGMTNPDEIDRWLERQDALDAEIQTKTPIVLVPPPAADDDLSSEEQLKKSIKECREFDKKPAVVKHILSFFGKAPDGWGDQPIYRY